MGVFHRGASASPSRPFVALALGLTLLVSACGLGRNDAETEGSISDPVVAATVNGRPIYIEDVRRRAVQMQRLEEGADLSAESDVFYLTLEELIQYRLFAMEAEARGLDREPDVRRQLENARERVLAASVYEELDRVATDPEAIRRLYRENYSRLEQDPEIHLRHIQFNSREEADAAKRRLDGGERFEVLAFELSTNRETAADGGDLGWRSVSDLAPDVRSAIDRANVGEVLGPLEISETWHLLRVDDLRQHGAPSLEELRPRIVEWLRFREIQQLYEDLSESAEIVRLREPDTSLEPGGAVEAPEDAGAPETPASAPATAPPDAPPSGAARPAPPLFPFAVGGGSGDAAPAPTPEPAAPAAQPAAPAPAQTSPAETPQ